MFVILITSDAAAHATAPAIHSRFTKFEFSWNSFEIPTATIALSACPMKEFLGWARGERMEL